MSPVLQIVKLKNKLNKKYNKSKTKKHFMKKIYFFKYVMKLYIDRHNVVDYPILYDLCEMLNIYSSNFRFLDSYENYTFAHSKIVKNKFSGIIYLINDIYKIKITLCQKNNEIQIVVQVKYSGNTYNFQTNDDLKITNQSKKTKQLAKMVNTICIDCYNSLLRKLWKDNIVIKEG